MIARPKHQRLVLVIGALAAVVAAVLLAMWGLRDRAAYFYTPADVAAGKAQTGVLVARPARRPPAGRAAQRPRAAAAVAVASPSA